MNRVKKASLARVLLDTYVSQNPLPYCVYVRICDECGKFEYAEFGTLIVEGLVIDLDKSEDLFYERAGWQRRGFIWKQDICPECARENCKKVIGGS